MSSTTYCLECKKEIGHSSEKCPHCGSSFPRGVAGRFFITGAACLFFAYFAYGYFTTFFWGFFIVGIIATPLSFILYKAEKHKLAEIESELKDATYDNDYETSHKEQYQTDPPPVECYWENPGKVPVNASLAIEYTSATGEQTSREIDISSYDGSAYINSYCNVRGEPRTFRVDRITSCVDTVTGEVVEDVPTHLLNKYKKTAKYIFENKQYVKEVIRVLYYVGKSDSQLRKEERAIIYKVFRQITKQPNFSDEEIAKVINNIAPLSPQAFKLAVGKIAKIKIELLKYTYKAAQHIVDTQKTVHPNEQEALDFMAKKLTESTKQTAPLPN